MEEFFAIIIFLIVLSTLIFVGWNISTSKKSSEKKINQVTKKFNENTVNVTSYLSTKYSKTANSRNKKIYSSLLESYSWLETTEKLDKIYTFQNNLGLLITTNGIVQKGTYELLPNNSGIILTIDNVSTHFEITALKNDFLILKKISTESIIILANRTKYKNKSKSELNQEIINYPKN